MNRDAPTEVLSFALPPELAPEPTFVAIEHDAGVKVRVRRTGNVATREDDGKLWNPEPEVPTAPESPLMGKVPLDFVPSNEEELKLALHDPLWRICSGQLYKILVKTKQPNDPGTVVPFRPNRAQRRLMARLWHRNVILKARQLGFTTLVCIMWLDHALFNAHQRCGIVAQDKDAAEAIFRDKVRLAYNNLPESLRQAMPLTKESASELMFEHNGSAFRVGVSLRSGTYHRLHVSEFGKIGAKYPDKAAEVITGTLPTVPLDGIAIVESTAEGQEGEFYKMVQRSMDVARSGRDLTEKDFRFHFYPWWQEPGYRIKGAVEISDSDRKYFHETEALIGRTLDQEQRNWYVATRDSEFGGDPEKMWQEYPSFPAEAFQVSTEGCYYAVQMADARKAGRITRVPYVEGVPVNTFWDIGNSDGTAIWLHQRIGFEDRFIGFIEGWGESYAHFIKELQDLRYVWGTHYLPHDADHKRQQGRRVCSPKDELEELGLAGDWVIVDRVDEVLHGIQKTRQCFGNYWFDAEKCAEGIAHLQNYRKKWDKARGKWKVEDPSKIDGHSEAADALRQHAQGYQAPAMNRGDTNGARRNWRTS